MNGKDMNTDSPVKALSRLTGGLAHEIRNPLSTLQVNLELLAEDLRELDPENDAVRRNLKRAEVMRNEITRLSEILDDFLRFVTHHELDLQVRNINEVIAQLIEFYQPQAAGHAVRIMTNFHPHPLTCRVDADLFKQAMLNLFFNAQQAMPEGGDLMIRTQAMGAQARIDVIDTGTGIPTEYVDKVFQVYFSTKKDGTGLGLAMASRIVQEHGGQIRVESEKGKGTSFSITMPLYTSQQEGQTP